MSGKTAAALLFLASSFASAQTPTFHKDVLPILQARCQECHRPGEIGPMAFLNYEGTRPWAKSIKAAVLQGKMPPWPADPHYGHFANDRKLGKTEIDTLVAWADGGAPEGNPKDAPRPRTWVEGWNIAKPDRVVKLPKPFPVPAKGEIEYQYIVIPSGFTEDKWVEQIEVRPTNRAVVHHVVIYQREPDSKWLREAPVGEPYVPKPRNARERLVNTGGGDSEILTTYTPGMVPDIWRPGQAKLVKAGTDFVFQMHYTANGTAGEDQTEIGFVFANEPVKERVLTLGPSNIDIKVPAGDADYKAEVNGGPMTNVTLLSLFPHLHLRGKAFQYDVVYPDKHQETLLKLNSWDLGWQLSYKLADPIKLPAGSRIHATAWWDNSANNPSNPDPTKTVGWGEQSWEEMFVAFYDIAFDAHMDLGQLFLKK